MKLKTKKLVCSRETKITVPKAQLDLYIVEDEKGYEWSLIVAKWATGEKDCYIAQEVLNDLDFNFLYGEGYEKDVELCDVKEGDEAVEWDGEFIGGGKGGNYNEI